MFAWTNFTPELGFFLLCADNLLFKAALSQLGMGRLAQTKHKWEGGGLESGIVGRSQGAPIWPPVTSQSGNTNNGTCECKQQNAASPWSHSWCKTRMKPPLFLPFSLPLSSPSASPSATLSLTLNYHCQALGTESSLLHLSDVGRWRALSLSYQISTPVFLTLLSAYLRLRSLVNCCGRSVFTLRHIQPTPCLPHVYKSSTKQVTFFLFQTQPAFPRTRWNLWHTTETERVLIFSIVICLSQSKKAFRLRVMSEDVGVCVVCWGSKDACFIRSVSEGLWPDTWARGSAKQHTKQLQNNKTVDWQHPPNELNTSSYSLYIFDISRLLLVMTLQCKQTK